MKTISIFKRAGKFAENKLIARDIRCLELAPAIKNDEEVIIDFSGVDAATQGFIHALISDLFREFGEKTADRLKFQSCNEEIKTIIAIVFDYTKVGAQ